MSKLAKILEKAGLIEREYEPTPESVLEPEPIEQKYSNVTIDPPAQNSHESDYVLAEGVSIELIYQEASVPASNYTVERLGKLIDGLKQLDSVTQRAAILAMDSADDTWSIEDILQDAGKKVEALRAYSSLATSKVARIRESIEKDVQRLAAEKDQSIASIRAQISELQQLLESTVSQHAAEAAKLNAQALSAQQAVDREQQRISAQIEKINTLIFPFTSSSSSTSTP
jgi:vacuolar-type H+-ATPase subunit I/STV1